MKEWDLKLGPLKRSSVLLFPTAPNVLDPIFELLIAFPMNSEVIAVFKSPLLFEFSNFLVNDNLDILFVNSNDDKEVIDIKDFITETPKIRNRKKVNK